MATFTKKADTKAKQEPEAENEKRRPDYIARCKQASDSDYWISIGAAWKFKSGEPGLAIRLHSLPVTFDGTFLLLPPLPEQSEDKGK